MLEVATTRADGVDALSAELGSRGLTTSLVLPLLTVRRRRGTLWRKRGSGRGRERFSEPAAGSGGPGRSDSALEAPLDGLTGRRTQAGRWRGEAVVEASFAGDGEGEGGQTARGDARWSGACPWTTWRYPCLKSSGLIRGERTRRRARGERSRRRASSRRGARSMVASRTCCRRRCATKGSGGRERRKGEAESGRRRLEREEEVGRSLPTAGALAKTRSGRKVKATS